MGYSKLSGAKRAQFDNRAMRRGDREVINDALEEMRTEDGLDRIDAMNNIALTRRELILSGINPDDRSRSMSLEELDAAVKTLGELTKEENQQYHSTVFSITYYAMLADDLYSMDPNPLDDLIDDSSADDYFAHEQDMMMA